MAHHLCWQLHNLTANSHHISSVTSGSSEVFGPATIQLAHMYNLDKNANY